MCKTPLRLLPLLAMVVHTSCFPQKNLSALSKGLVVGTTAITLCAGVKALYHRKKYRAFMTESDSIQRLSANEMPKLHSLHVDSGDVLNNQRAFFAARHLALHKKWKYIFYASCAGACVSGVACAHLPSKDAKNVGMPSDKKDSVVAVESLSSAESVESASVSAVESKSSSLKAQAVCSPVLPVRRVRNKQRIQALMPQIITPLIDVKRFLQSLDESIVENGKCVQDQVVVPLLQPIDNVVVRDEASVAPQPQLEGVVTDEVVQDMHAAGNHLGTEPTDVVPQQMATPVAVAALFAPPCVACPATPKFHVLCDEPACKKAESVPVVVSEQEEAINEVSSPDSQSELLLDSSVSLDADSSPSSEQEGVLTIDTNIPYTESRASAASTISCASSTSIASDDMRGTPVQLSEKKKTEGVLSPQKRTPWFFEPGEKAVGNHQSVTVMPVSIEQTELGMCDVAPCVKRDNKCDGANEAATLPVDACHSLYPLIEEPVCDESDSDDEVVSLLSGGDASAGVSELEEPKESPVQFVAQSSERELDWASIPQRKIQYGIRRFNTPRDAYLWLKDNLSRVAQVFIVKAKEDPIHKNKPLLSQRHMSKSQEVNCHMWNEVKNLDECLFTGASKIRPSQLEIGPLVFTDGSNMGWTHAKGGADYLWLKVGRYVSF